MNNNIIKPIIFQTWRNKNFHRKIEKLRKGMVNSNPNFDFRLFSNEEMDSSIEEYFDYDIINSYFIQKGSVNAPFFLWCRRASPYLIGLETFSQFEETFCLLWGY